MITETIQARYVNGVIEPLKPINKNYKRIFITVEYFEEEKKLPFDKYLENEYEKDEIETFLTPEDFLLDLQKYKN